MVVEHRTIHLFGRKIFEKAVVIPPFKNPNPLDEEACFLYVLEGSNHSFSEEEHLLIHQEEGVLMKCGNYMYQGVANEETGHFTLVAIHFYPDILTKVYEKEIPDFLKNKGQRSYQNNMTRIENDILIQKYMEHLLFYFKYPKLINDELVILKLKEIILLLLNTQSGPAILEIMYNLFSPRSFSFKQMVEAHIFSPISIPDLAKLTNHSLSSFKREFKKIYEDSPANYIKNRRLEKAAELLVISKEPINAIAYDCQFNDVAYFSTAFKAKYHYSPSQYRLNQFQK